MGEKEKLLIVDDEPDMLSLVARVISSEVQWEVFTTVSAFRAIEIMKETQIDVVLLDIRMPEMSGMELLDRIKKNGESPTVVMMTAYGVIDLAVNSIRKGAYDFITKPFDETRLILTLKKAMEHHGLVHENERLKRCSREEDIFENMVGTGPLMKEIFQTIHMVGKTTATVLITGESGTGKELVAKAIHQLSPRCGKPFVTVNCPTLPEHILESELFGHMKGAFTDATYDRKGLFQEAHGGTIFLDEIGDLPMRLQTKLLRVLQEKEIKPLGHTKSFKVDVRVVASTNRNLQERMAARKFREDLYYRLNVVSIELPPLRKRLEDLPVLVDRLQKKYAKEFGKKGLKLSLGFVDALYRHPWHGNVRELENTVKRAIILSKSNVISVADLAPEVKEVNQFPDPVIHLPYRKAKAHVLSRFNHEYLTRVLRLFKGNVTHAAKQCGLERQSLQHLLRRYDIKAQAFREKSR